jgi:hypothetical protein
MITFEFEHWEGIAPTQIFLVYRERPFSNEIPQEEFEALNDLYMALANKTPNVTVLRNDGSIESALHRIAGAVVDDAASGDGLPETQLFQ